MLILLLILLGAVSCVRQEMPSGSGSLRIVFETGALQTKAADGGEIFCSGSGTELDPYRPDLIIVVADAGGTIRGKYIGTAASNTNSQLEGTPAGTRMSVSITGLSGPATYTVYAFANTQGLWTMKCGETTVTSLASALSGVSPLITSASQIEALQFQPVAADLDNGYPKVLASRLPLSAKGTTEVKASGNGEIALPLLRCVAKVTAVFENQYGSDLMLYGYQSTFTHMNPATGYVVKHADDFLVEHDDALDGDISDSEDSVAIPDDGVYSKSWYVFPSSGPYTCNVSFYTDAGRTDHHVYPNLPVHDYRARDIAQLARNQHLTITTRISKGKQVSFNFEVADWGSKTETVVFN